MATGTQELFFRLTSCPTVAVAFSDVSQNRLAFAFGDDTSTTQLIPSYFRNSTTMLKPCKNFADAAAAFVHAVPLLTAASFAR